MLLSIPGSHQCQVEGNPPWIESNLQWPPHGGRGGQGGPFQRGGPACQSFEEALHWWSWVLKDSGELFPLTVEQWQHLTGLVIYSYLSKQFHLKFYYTGAEDVEGGSRAEKVCSIPGVRGTPGPGVGLDWYPCKLARWPHGCWGLWSQQVGSSFFQGPFP